VKISPAMLSYCDAAHTTSDEMDGRETQNYCSTYCALCTSFPMQSFEIVYDMQIFNKHSKSTK